MAKDEKPEKDKKIPSPLEYLRDLSKMEYVKHQPQHKKDKEKDNG